MGRRCNCAGNCSCVFKEGRGVQMSGDGTAQSPVEIQASAPTYLVGSATNNIQVELEGSGTDDDPYVVQASEISPDREPTTYVFATPGVYLWTKPSFGARVRVYIVGAGAGGGGASGALGYDTDAALGPNTYFGQGGQGGGREVYEALMADLPATVGLTVGAGGSGGAGAPAPLVPTAGSNGQASIFNGSQASGGLAMAVLATQYAPAVPFGPGQGGNGGQRSEAAVYPHSPAGTDGFDGYFGQIGSGTGGIGATPGGSVNGGTGLGGTSLFRPAGGGGGGGLGSIVGAYTGGGAGGNGAAGSGGGGAGTGATSGGASGGRGGDGIIVILVE